MVLLVLLVLLLWLSLVLLVVVVVPIVGCCCCSYCWLTLDVDSSTVEAFAELENIRKSARARNINPGSSREASYTALHCGCYGCCWCCCCCGCCSSYHSCSYSFGAAVMAVVQNSICHAMIETDAVLLLLSVCQRCLS